MNKPKNFSHSHVDVPRPPRQLGEAGRLLWKQIQDEYRILDAGGLCHLLSACRAEDDIQRFRETVAREGDVLKSDPWKPHPLLQCIRGSEGVRRQSLKALDLPIPQEEPKPRVLKKYA